MMEGEDSAVEFDKAVGIDCETQSGAAVGNRADNISGLRGIDAHGFEHLEEEESSKFLSVDAQQGGNVDFSVGLCHCIGFSSE